MALTFLMVADIGDRTDECNRCLFIVAIHTTYYMHTGPPCGSSSFADAELARIWYKLRGLTSTFTLGSTLPHVEG